MLRQIALIKDELRLDALQRLHCLAKVYFFGFAGLPVKELGYFFQEVELLVENFAILAVYDVLVIALCKR